MERCVRREKGGMEEGWEVRTGKGKGKRRKEKEEEKKKMDGDI